MRRRDKRSGVKNTSSGARSGELFDFNLDGKESLFETIVGLKIFTRFMKKGSCKTDSRDALNLEYAWREDYEDDFIEYGIDPEDYETEEEYVEALNEAKYAWREDYEDDFFEYGVDPDDYETEEEYVNALNEAKYAWREDCEDGSEYGIDPDDYETEEEYDKALIEAKYARSEDDDDDEDDFFEYDIDPDDYENNFIKYGIDPDDYETEEEYIEAIKEAKYEWRLFFGDDY